MDGWQEQLASEQAMLRAYLLALLGKIEDAEECLQETNLLAVKELAKGKNIQNFPAWLRTLAFWEVKTWRLNKARGRLVFENDSFEKVAEDSSEQFSLLEAKKEHLRECLLQLPSEWRRVLELRYWQGKAVRKIARELGKSDNSVSHMLVRARQALARALTQWEEQMQ